MLRNLPFLLCLLLWNLPAQGALHFDGVDDIVNFGDENTFDNGTAGWSLLCWVFPDQTVHPQAVLVGDTSTDFLNGVIVQNDPGNNLHVQVCNAGVTFAETTNGVWTSNVWHHLGVVFNGAGSGNAGRLKIWVDGVAQVPEFTGTIPATIGNNSESLFIGNFTTNSTLPWKGSVEDFWLTTRVLTERDVIHHFKSKRRSDLSLTGIEVYCPMNEGPRGTGLHGINLYNAVGKTILGGVRNGTNGSGCISVSGVGLSGP